MLLHAAVIWTAAAVIRLPTLMWRMPRGRLPRVAAASWSAGALAVVVLLAAGDPLIPPLPLVLALAVAAGCALSLPRLRVRARRGSQSMRFGGAFLALLVPAMAMYPSLSAFAIQAKERLIATQYGPQATSMRDDLQQRLFRALEQIDELPGLPELVTAARRRRHDDEPRVRRLVPNRPRDLSGDVGRRALRERRPAPQPLRAPSARILVRRRSGAPDATGT